MGLKRSRRDDRLLSHAVTALTAAERALPSSEVAARVNEQDRHGTNACWLTRMMRRDDRFVEVRAPSTHRPAEFDLTSRVEDARERLKDVA